MISIILELVGLLLLCAIGVHALILHRRLSRFREALGEMGEILPNLDSSVGRMQQAAGGFSQRLQADMQAVEGRIAAARRLANELAAANRAAEQAAGQLDTLLRQHRRLEANRAAPKPRELVEPLGFAERAGLPPIAEGSNADATSDKPTARQEAS